MEDPTFITTGVTTKFLEVTEFDYSDMK
jgi:hypothetical protein